MLKRNRRNLEKAETAKGPQQTTGGHDGAVYFHKFAREYKSKENEQLIYLLLLRASNTLINHAKFNTLLFFIKSTKRLKLNKSN